MAEHARGDAGQLTLLALLKCHQHLGYTPSLTDVPSQIRTYLSQQLHLPADPALDVEKVESYNTFTDWLAFGGPVLRTGDPVEQEKRIKYRDLVANVVMLQNVVDMTNVLHD